MLFFDTCIRISSIFYIFSHFQNGLYSSLPYVFMYLMTLLFGCTADFIGNRRIMSLVNIRRTANSIGMVLSGIFLVAFGYVHSTLLAVVLITLCLGAHSGVHVGFNVSMILKLYFIVFRI